MSALLLQRRQHQIDNLHQYQHPHYSISSTSSPLPTTNLPLRVQNAQHFLTPIPSEAEIARLSHSPYSTTESSPATSTLDFDTRGDYYMQRVPDSITQDSSQQHSRYPSLETNGIQQAFWNSQQPRSAIGPQRLRHSIPSTSLHKRTNSDSTVHSAPYTPTSFPQPSYQPYIVDSESQQYSLPQDIYDQQSQNITSVPKNFAQVTQSFDHSHLYAPDNQTAYFNDAQSQLHWNEAMREALLQQQPFQGQIYHTMENQGDISGSIQDKMQSFPKIPGLGPRTISEMCQDELYNVAEQTIPTEISTPTTPKIHTDGQRSSPVNSVFSQRLQAASQGHLEAARSASPTTSTFSRDKSPFRPVLSGSPYDSPTSPGPRMNITAQMREAQQNEAAAFVLANAARRASRESSQTVSPKEVSLEYEPSDSDTQQALFGSPPRHGQHQKRPSRLKEELTQNTTFENLLKKEESSNVSNESMTSTGSLSIQVPQQYPFVRTHRPSTSGIPESSQESNPRFPSTLISMESTRSEKSDRSSNGRSPEVDEEASLDEEDTQETEIARPDNTRSDGGTYTCTYHGCTQRFETPQKLQKHKKEGHRQGTPSTNADSRLTQAGPHKCERLNPQTGKPCNSIFSRPYDLTRHEDTIHNAKKQKVRCMICTEDKTFSRNDALTRHMRVVHPEIEFPGKTKRGSR